MNTYNDNLRNSVVTSLNAQELQLTQTKALLDASMFTLYYAEGALFSAYDDIEFATAKYAQAEKIDMEAVNNNDVATSLLTTAQLENANVALAVSNAAVAAANVEIAANAILRLASDVGSIFSIVSAADHGVNIFDQSEYAHYIMDQTAYLAEDVSRYAMNASQLTAEVSSVAVENAAKVTSESVAQLLTIAKTDFDNATTLLETNNENYANASIAERKAEGSLEDSNVGYYAAESSYYLTNEELNIGLMASYPAIEMLPVIREVLDEENSSDNKDYSVVFKQFKSPFNLKEAPDSLTISNVETGYPVSSYYIMLAKDKSKSTFNMATAESLLRLGEEYWVEVPSDRDFSGDSIIETIGQNRLLDSDGDLMELGQEYVVFVLAVLMDDYKKILNTYDDYLTAPSAPFKLTNKLAMAENLEVNLFPFGELVLENEEAELRVQADLEQEQVLSFQIPSILDTYPTEYRCMFLPIKDGIKGLLTAPGLRDLESEIKRLERIAESHDPGIREAVTEINELLLLIEELVRTIKREMNLLNKIEKLIDGEPNEEYLTLSNKIEADKATLKLSKGRIKEVKMNLKVLESAKEKEIVEIPIALRSECGFFFNLIIAEQVSAANYSIASKGEPTELGEVSKLEDTAESIALDKKKKTGKGKKKEAAEAIEMTLPVLPEVNNYYVKIGPNTTDNFGSRLIDGMKYIPVVLSYTAALDSDQKEYANTLSDFELQEDFVYMSEETIISLTVNLD